MNIRIKGRKIFSYLSDGTKWSIRQIAGLTKISKSSVARHKNALEKRNLYPESYFWETDEGYSWLRHLYSVVILHFGVHCGIGAEKISSFFEMIRIDKHVGISPSTIKERCVKACDLLEEYRKIQEESLQLQKPLKVVGGVDETYFKNMILVLMDLPSGYIFLEEESEDKSYETWHEKTKKIADKFKIKFKFIVSDRAQQLIKLATHGFDCPSIPDLFHASNELAKLFALNLNRKKAQIKKKLATEMAKLAMLNELSKDISGQTIVVKKLESQEMIIDKGIATYKNILYKLSVMLHPFDINDSSKVYSNSIEIQLNNLLKEAEKLKNEHNISNKTDHLKKFENQIHEMASLIDTWWLWVNESLNDEIDEGLKSWLTQYLLPWLYWHNQTNRTKDPDLKEAYRYASEKARSKLETQPSTQNHIENKKLISWAKRMVSNFQRTSSAVEGRNGWLSQMHHNGRGITSKRLKAQTILHNYYLKRSDDSTTAERLFGQSFPNPITWVAERMGDLPLPRASVVRCEM